MSSVTAELSVILLTPDGLGSIGETLTALRAQSAARRIELVVVAPLDAPLHPGSSELEGFAGVVLARSATFGSSGPPRAEGIRRASAPVVALAEDHSFPQPDWAELLIAAHREPWGAVGPAVLNANLPSAVGSADYLLNFGRWQPPLARAPQDDLPWHNSSYKRVLLLQEGNRLPLLLEAQGLLHAALRRGGNRLLLEPAARTRHVNVSHPRAFVQSHYVGGRVFGALRAELEAWPARRRRLYLLGGPAIPLVRLRRVVQAARRHPEQRFQLPGLVPALFAGLSAHSAGEMLGYAAGAGGAREHESRLEFHRERLLSARDRAAGVLRGAAGCGETGA